ncbi:hypothetical protein GCM10012275_34690 [Longimycelium tulufanense]|uniref:Uncharacterized protein n=1 Tax=Longimycelium tulufanense TaxID=907463 RepID=A0A8J3C9H1_9PSEU|nr:hypothetical protein [Longimycelium tulufanense]GGM60713.1 hypothetical protein GCM10012275_34690 [Longimycelium tulufanense]
MTVIPADTRPTGYVIPSESEPRTSGGLQLDQALVQAKMQESAAVAALLADVFEDEQDGPEDLAESATAVP